MLFYERRKKKDIKVLVEEGEVEALKQKGVEVHEDADKKEFFKYVNYRKSTESEKPNQIYSKVFDDNKKFTFENDIYSQEFFDFILGIMQSIVNINEDGSDAIKIKGLQIGRKVGFEILARCMQNVPGIKRVSEVMI